MTTWAWVLAVAASAGAEGRLPLPMPVDALPWERLVGPGRQAWGVVVMPSLGVLSVDGEEELSRALVRALSERRGVRAATEYDAPALLADLPDDEVGRRVAAEMGVGRVLVARVRGPGPAVRLLVAVVDAGGTTLADASTSASSSPAPLPGAATPPAPPPVAVSAPPAPPPPVVTDERPALDRFREQALTVHQVDGRTRILRGGRKLNANELGDLGVPDAGPGPAGPRLWVVAPAAALLPTVLALPLCAAGTALGLCTGCGTAFGVVSTGSDLAGRIFVGVVVFDLFGLPFMGLAAAVGLFVGAGVTAVGAGALGYELLLRRPGDHPYVAFVNRHNRALAQSLGLDPADLGRRYFPGESEHP